MITWPQRGKFTFVLGLVFGYITLDTRGKGVTLALFLVVMCIVDAGVPVTWGSLMLAKLYRDLHQIVYQGGSRQGRSIGFLTLLQVWAWEHIVVLRMLGRRER